MRGQYVGANIHFDYDGERYVFGSDTHHFTHTNKSETTFTLSNHGQGGDNKIKETFRLTTDELVEMIRDYKHKEATS